VPQLSPSVSLWSICGLLILFAFKHFVADFLLQTNWIAHGKERREGWQVPLAVHVGCHAGLTLLIALAFAPRLWWLALVELVIHAAIDRSKTTIACREGWAPNKMQFWWLLGFDQFLHQVTNVALAAAFFLL
jgi:uncharacterized protein DUF3307